MARISNPTPELKRAVRRAEEALAAAERDGFQGIEQRMGSAALGSARLAEVLGSFADHGFSPNHAKREPIQPEEVQSAISATRATLGALALVTPTSLSGDYEAYVAAVRTLIKVADAVRDRGVVPGSKESDEWSYFQRESTTGGSV